MADYTQEELNRYRELAGEICKYCVLSLDCTDWPFPQIKNYLHTPEEIKRFREQMGEICKGCGMSRGDGSIGGSHLHRGTSKRKSLTTMR